MKIINPDWYKNGEWIKCYQHLVWSRWQKPQVQEPLVAAEKKDVMPRLVHLVRVEQEINNNKENYYGR